MFKKIYPKVVRMKKSVITVIIIFAALIITLIITNISRHQNVHKIETKEEPQKTKTITTAGLDNLWYKSEEVRASKQPANTLKINNNNSRNNHQNGKQQNNKQNQNTNNTQDNMQEEREKALLKAQTAPISAQQININTANTTETKYNRETNSNHQRPQTQQYQQEDQNMQQEKREFMEEAGKKDADYLHETVKSSISPYEIKAGTIIPGILISGINSDLPGQIIAQVRSNVYDTVTGKYLLIPQGAKLIGLYDSQVTYGQERVLIVWKRIIMPNGKSINLEGMPGVDMSGYAGFNDKVNHHYGKIFGSVLLLSVITAGTQLSVPDDDNDDDDTQNVEEVLATSLGTNLMTVANNLTSKNLGIQPTLEIRQGYLFNISVTKDIVFEGEYQ